MPLSTPTGLLVLAMLVGQVVGFSQFPEGASEEGGDLRASRAGASALEPYIPWTVGLRRVDQGGATSCGYKRPANERGCPLLLSGCIEPTPVPEQCAVYEENVASACGDDPYCGGVVCREDYKHDGKQFCLVRWDIDEMATDEASSNNRRWAFYVRGRCGPGTTLINGVCRALNRAGTSAVCGTGTKLRNGMCEPDPDSVCGAGTRWWNGKCAREGGPMCGARFVWSETLRKCVRSVCPDRQTDEVVYRFCDGMYVCPP